MPVTGDILERQRDLAAQDAALRVESNQDVVFTDMTPRPAPVMIYAMSDGEPIPMPPWIARMAMAKRYGDGRYLFTADQSKAPVYKLGAVKCFLHAESTERKTGLLEAAGVDMWKCISEHHPSKYAMEEVAKSKHSKQWAALQAYIKEQERLEERAERRQQLDATLALAGRAVGTPAVDIETALSSVRFDCGDCGWENEKNTEQGLELHKNRWCKEKQDAVTE